MKRSSLVLKLFFFILVVGLITGFGYYYLFLENSNEGESGIIPSLSGKKVYDVKNGVYIIKNKLEREKTLLGRCLVNSINDYLVVLNDDYMLYKGNCLNTVLISEGKSENLKFDKKNDSKYTVTLDEKTYQKDDSINEIPVVNNVIIKSPRVNYDSLKFIIDNSEYEGHYYSFSGEISSQKEYYYDYSYNQQLNQFSISLNNGISGYSKILKSFNDIPKFYTFNDYLLVLDEDKIGNSFSHKLYLYSEKEMIYDFNSIFPININGNVIDTNWNRMFRFDMISKTAYVVFDRDNNFCNFENGNEYYEFKLTYDYQKNGFNVPDLLKKGTKESDCDYIKKKYSMEG